MSLSSRKATRVKPRRRRNIRYGGGRLVVAALERGETHCNVNTGHVVPDLFSRAACGSRAVSLGVFSHAVLSSAQGIPFSISIRATQPRRWCTVRLRYHQAPLKELQLCQCE